MPEPEFATTDLAVEGVAIVNQLTLDFGMGQSGRTSDDLDPPIDSGTDDENGPLATVEITPVLESLVELFSHNRRAFLLGAGCSKCAGLPLMRELTSRVLEGLEEESPARSVMEGLVSHFGGGSEPNIEDYMSELVDFIAISERRQTRRASNVKVTVGEKSFRSDELSAALRAIKKQVEKAISRDQVELSFHRDFVRAIHGRLGTGRAHTISPVDYFTLNYDTLIEDALAIEKVPMADGFVGGATGWWSPEVYESDGIEARVFKVHGSTDWCMFPDEVLPRRIRPGLPLGGGGDPVVIWPAATKYREAQLDPYAQIIEFLRRVLRPGSNGETVLGVLGYSFGDAHINHELDRALKEADGRLTILVFTDAREPTGLVQEWLLDPRISDQVRVHSRRGFFHGADEIRTQEDLPWWRFEVLTKLIGG